jgi:hypothetical protein
MKRASAIKDVLSCTGLAGNKNKQKKKKKKEKKSQFQFYLTSAVP